MNYIHARNKHIPTLDIQKYVSLDLDVQAKYDDDDDDNDHHNIICQPLFLYTPLFLEYAVFTQNSNT